MNAGMHRRQSWPLRLLIGAALGALVVFVWIRQEAYIATTPTQVYPEERATVSDEGSRPRAIEDLESLRNTNIPGQPVPRWVLSDAKEGEGEARDVDVIEPAESIRGPGSDGQPSDISSSFNIHRSAFIPVPFVSQAPFRVWDLPYKEFCEEASVLTVHYWKQGQKPPVADQIDRDLKDIQAWETANLRTWDDTTAEETARVLREKFGHANTRVVRNVTIENITSELDAGRPVIVPAAGRELSSPYYKPPGPLYHMLVIIGYDDAKREFITNDVGTNTKGAGFRFAYDDLHGAMGDWDAVAGAPNTLQKTMIVVE
jgi:hypothetical protein